MEFAILHNSLIPSNEPEGKNLIVEDMGKTITIIPYHQPILDYTKDLPDAQKILEKIKILSESQNNALYLSDNHLYFTSFSVNELSILLENDWFENFCNLIEKSPLFDFSYPSLYLKNNTDCIKSYIPAGCPPEIHKWASMPFKAANHNSTNTNIKNFLYTYQEVQYLYSRMMYVSLVVSQSRGDKIRKRTAREFLWQAQTQDSYWFLGDSGIGCNEIRSNAYKNLLTAEKYVRETNSKNVLDKLFAYLIHVFIKETIHFILLTSIFNRLGVFFAITRYNYKITVTQIFFPYKLSNSTRNKFSLVKNCVGFANCNTRIFAIF